MFWWQSLIIPVIKKQRHTWNKQMISCFVWTFVIWFKNIEDDDHDVPLVSMHVQKFILQHLLLFLPIQWQPKWLPNRNQLSFIGNENQSDLPPISDLLQMELSFSCLIFHNDLIGFFNLVSALRLAKLLNCLCVGSACWDNYGDDIDDLNNYSGIDTLYLLNLHKSGKKLSAIY